MEKGLVVITGASSGIGKKTAELFSIEGYPLLLIGRRVEQIEALNLPNSIAVKGDVTDLLSFERAIEKGEKEFGPVQTLINNAGIMLLGDVAFQNPDEWKKMYDVNVLGVLHGIHLVLHKMINRKEGTIINISSIAGRKTFPNHAAYCGTKFAVHALTENIREEVAKDNVRLITIAPGAVETELLSHTTSEEIKEGYEHWKKEIGGALSPETIADAIFFAAKQPQSVCVREIVIAATTQGS
ncbi:MAG: SDR family oxidoreductase [Chlamydiia bacterium]|nr:SDR family oxidoreductase [Chlamydiia bacterium]